MCGGNLLVPPQVWGLAQSEAFKRLVPASRKTMCWWKFSASIAFYKQLWAINCENWCDVNLNDLSSNHQHAQHPDCKLLHRNEKRGISLDLIVCNVPFQISWKKKQKQTGHAQQQIYHCGVRFTRFARFVQLSVARGTAPSWSCWRILRWADTLGNAFLLSPSLAFFPLSSPFFLVFSSPVLSSSPLSSLFCLPFCLRSHLRSHQPALQATGKFSSAMSSAQENLSSWMHNLLGRSETAPWPPRLARSECEWRNFTAIQAKWTQCESMCMNLASHGFHKYKNCLMVLLVVIVVVLFWGPPFGFGLVAGLVCPVGSLRLLSSWFAHCGQKACLRKKYFLCYSWQPFVHQPIWWLHCSRLINFCWKKEHLSTCSGYIVS